jgi:ferrous iron transport protein B
VLTFLPVLVIFFAVFALLEDVGYMARAAYVMDNLMHLMCLHGKSFLPYSRQRTGVSGPSVTVTTS